MQLHGLLRLAEIASYLVCYEHAIHVTQCQWLHSNLTLSAMCCCRYWATVLAACPGDMGTLPPMEPGTICLASLLHSLSAKRRGLSLYTEEAHVVDSVSAVEQASSAQPVPCLGCCVTVWPGITAVGCAAAVPVLEGYGCRSRWLAAAALLLCEAASLLACCHLPDIVAVLLPVAGVIPLPGTATA